MIYAHQGGWDETLLVLAPIAAIVFLVWLAKRRAERAQAARSVRAEPEPNLDDDPGGRGRG